MKNKVDKINTLMYTFSVFLIITGLNACKIPKIVNNRTICFYTHNSWTSEDNSKSLKIDSVNGIWHYITFLKNNKDTLLLTSFLKGDLLQCFDEASTMHWSIRCKGTNIEIFDLDSQSYFELIKDKI